MINMDEKQIIVDLDKISLLYNEQVDIENKIQSLIEAREIQLKTIKKGFKRTINSIKNEVQTAFFAAVASAEIMGVTHSWYPPRHWRSKENIKDFGWKKSFNERMSPTEKERHYNAFRSYDKLFLSMIEEYKKKEAEEKQKYQTEITSVRKQFEQSMTELSSRKEDISNQLHDITIISDRLFADATRISNILKDGRADSLKEAINLALDEKRKENAEEQRREEALRQEIILERQARENRMHNEAMQRAAEEEARVMREHNATMERAAQAQANAAQAQAKILEQQARDARAAASARCSSCANLSKCSVYTRNHSINCTSYRPR